MAYYFDRFHLRNTLLPTNYVFLGSCFICQEYWCIDRKQHCTNEPDVTILIRVNFYKFSANAVRLHTKKPQRSRLVNGVVQYLQFIMANKDSRYLFFFLLANLAFMVVELIYGLISNSLGLISDSGTIQIENLLTF
jgi:hypothetical protein